MFILVVDAVVAGALAGLVANAADLSGAGVAIAAAATGACYLAAWLLYIARRLIDQERRYEPLFPHPAD
jgi:hypothetical protein